MPRQPIRSRSIFHRQARLVARPFRRVYTHSLRPYRSGLRLLCFRDSRDLRWARSLTHFWILGPAPRCGISAKCSRLCMGMTFQSSYNLVEPFSADGVYKKISEFNSISNSLSIKELESVARLIQVANHGSRCSIEDISALLTMMRWPVGQRFPGPPLLSTLTLKRWILQELFCFENLPSVRCYKRIFFR
jgi:hypothetical protein